ncbi:MAG: ATP-binding cassette domain-containing protein [bacterium]|nr:ATP-binding cassette domain-containing protein [bacterium]MCY3579322.1 ATP-binding cassette domain-containing protein [bacterium]MDE0644561.1 ATP-binding cassette domain-containing protein [bacterium]
MTTPALQVEKLSKSFRAIQALDEVSMSLHRGRVTALLGDNGAGKSTLVKCLAGVYQPDSGTISIDGTNHRIATPDMAQSLGIETVHQNLSLIDTLDVSENLFLNREQTRGGWIGARLGVLNRGRMRSECRTALAHLEIKIPSLRQPVGLLSGGQRQAIAIGRAVAWSRHIVLLDEPAAALGVEQTSRVLDLIRRLRDSGIAVLLITHNMDRVTEVCDDAVILRRGKKTAKVEVDEVTTADLVGFITGAKTTV